MREANGKPEFPVVFEWMSMGVGHGTEAVVTDAEKNPKAVGVTLRHLLKHFAGGDFASAGIARCTLWCDCGEYFDVERFYSPKNISRSGTFRFSAVCAKEGTIRFFWANRSIRTCERDGVHRITSLVLHRPEQKSEPWKMSAQP